jgi:hypothetical protein
MELNIESARDRWAQIARENGWYTEPFYVQVWADTATGEILDSVSFTGLTEDIIVEQTLLDCQCPECEQDSWGDAYADRSENCLRGFCAKCLTNLGTDEDWGALCDPCHARKWASKTPDDIVTEALRALAVNLFSEGDDTAHEKVIQTLTSILNGDLVLVTVLDDRVPF